MVYGKERVWAQKLEAYQTASYLIGEKSKDRLKIK